MNSKISAMKKPLLIVCLLVLAITTFPQSEYKFYSNLQPKVVPFLDSIIKVYSDHFQCPEKEINYKVNPQTITKFIVFGENVNLKEAPNDSAKAIMPLKFSDFVYLPQYLSKDVHCGYYLFGGGVNFDYSCGVKCRNSYSFIFLENGKYGFINTKNLFKQNNRFMYESYFDDDKYYSVHGSDLLIFQHSGKTAIVNYDLTEKFIFNSIDFSISPDGNMLAYSINDNKDSCYQQLYIFNLATWQNEYILKGFSPSFFGDELIYWTKSLDIKKSEEIHIFETEDETDRIIFAVPDSMTLMACDPEFKRPHKIVKDSLVTGYELKLSLCLKNGNIQHTPYTIWISPRGEEIKIKKYSPCGD
jgi:hypothetical protein